MKFIITLDTEADDQWSSASRLATRNLSFLPRFQALCERYGFPPTYLCTWEVVHARDFERTLNDWQQREACEVGAHLHPWSNPPYEHDPEHAPGSKTYPSELPIDAFRQKMLMLSESIRRRTSQAPRSYRAGRWGFCAEHVSVLNDLDYWCDCSVTPLTSWQEHIGAQAGGPDFRRAGVEPYFLNQADVCVAGESMLLEVPVTILNTHPLGLRVPRWRLLRGVGKRLKLWREPQWLRPWPHGSGEELIRVYEAAKFRGLPMVEMMFHSSELMPGGSPFWPDEAAVERLYVMLEKLFAHAANDDAQGMTLRQFAEDYRAVRVRPQLPERWAA
ncbi:MAG: hypothetical protein IT445_10035 [Phycisphaeraceae bacterium]|nr:hypothetical protein [Phycisphaeraceae bacterium]